MGPLFKDSSERLEKPEIEPRTLGLQGQLLYHFTRRLLAGTDILKKKKEFGSLN